MQRNHNPHDETLVSSNFDQSLLDSMFSVCVDACPHDHHSSVQHENDDDADMECVSDMWENWLQVTSEPQTLNNAIFDASSSACMSPMPSKLSSQTSANSLPSSNTSIPVAIDASLIQPLPLSSEAPFSVVNEHDLHSFYKDHHVNEHLDTRIDYLTTANPPPLDNNLEAIVGPLPLNLGATLGQPLTYLKARASPHKMKTPGNYRNNGGRKNEEAKTFLVESSTVAVEDGYVWHKYGQKYIKNRIYPRGYFKCAQPNCPAKKQREISSDEQGFDLVTYIGEHNH